MRHGKKTNHLSRKTAHRSALLSNMACSLIEHKRINTTLAKAKALRKYVEPLITKSKEDTTHNRRVVFRYLKNKDASSVLFRDVAPKISGIPGGYTRIIKLNNRLGDNAEMAMIELVDFNELLIKDQSKKKKTRRRGGKKATSEVQKPKENIEAIEDAVIIEESSESINSEKEASEKTKKDESPKSETKTPEEKDDSKTTDPPKEG